MVYHIQGRYHTEKFQDEYDEVAKRYKCRICKQPSKGRFRFYCGKEHQQDFEKSLQYWSKVRDAVLKRDNNKCLKCGKEATEVHHKKPVCRHPELEFDESNCISLCHNCHSHKGLWKNKFKYSKPANQLTLDGNLVGDVQCSDQSQ